jgi:hypothetical protein
MTRGSRLWSGASLLVEFLLSLGGNAGLVPVVVCVHVPSCEGFAVLVNKSDFRFNDINTYIYYFIFTIRTYYFYTYIIIVSLG